MAAVSGGRQPHALRLAGTPALHALRWGDEADPTAVLVHGNGAHAHWFDALVPALAPGWRLLVPDLRGHGESDWAEPPAYAVGDFALDLERWIAAYAPARVVLVGHSMGGRVALWYAAQHPERVRGLALLDTRLTPVEPARAAVWRASVLGKRHGRTYATRAEALAAFRFVPDERDVPPAVVADLAHHALVESPPGRWTFRFDRAVLSLEGDRAGDLTPLLDELRCPLLLMAGERSWVMGEEQRAALAHPVMMFPGAHHFLLSHTAAVGAALRAFLDRLGA